MKLRSFLMALVIFCNCSILVHAEGPDYEAVDRVSDFLKTCTYDKNYADEVSKICLGKCFNVSQIQQFFVEDLKKTKKGVCRNFTAYAIDEFRKAEIYSKSVDCIKDNSGHVFVLYLSADGRYMAFDPTLLVQRNNFIQECANRGILEQYKEKIQSTCNERFDYHMPFQDYVEKYNITSTFVHDEEVSEKVCPYANDYFGVDLFTYYLIEKAMSGRNIFNNGNVPECVRSESAWHFPPAIDFSKKTRELEELSKSFRQDPNINLTREKAEEIIDMMYSLN